MHTAHQARAMDRRGAHVLPAGAVVIAVDDNPITTRAAQRVTLRKKGYRIAGILSEFDALTADRNGHGLRIRGIAQVFDLYGARYWDRTSGPCRVKAVLYR